MPKRSEPQDPERAARAALLRIGCRFSDAVIDTSRDRAGTTRSLRVVGLSGTRAQVDSAREYAASMGMRFVSL